MTQIERERQAREQWLADYSAFRAAVGRRPVDPRAPGWRDASRRSAKHYVRLLSFIEASRGARYAWMLHRAATHAVADPLALRTTGLPSLRSIATINLPRLRQRRRVEPLVR